MNAHSGTALKSLATTLHIRLATLSEMRTYLPIMMTIARRTSLPMMTTTIKSTPSFTWLRQLLSVGILECPVAGRIHTLAGSMQGLKQLLLSALACHMCEKNARGYPKSVPCVTSVSSPFVHKLHSCLLSLAQERLVKQYFVKCVVNVEAHFWHWNRDNLAVSFGCAWNHSENMHNTERKGLMRE